MSNSENLIKISVLIAARNEEDNIERCLTSLDAVNFPKENLEIIVGDDDSDDRTAELVQNFIKDKPHFKYIKIASQLAELKGKANVLAHLAHHASGDYFLYCDADIAVKPTWISEMRAHFKPKTGVVIGLTRMKHTHLLADLLSMEWLFALSTMRFFSLFKIPITGMGNNMAVTREAYFAIGGFEKIGFSIVEDYTLFIGVVRQGYDFQMAYKPEVLSISEPVNTFPELLKQRKRWMHGVMQSFWVTRLSLFVSSLIVPICLLIAIWYPIDALSSIVQYYVLITGISLLSIILLKQPDLWKAAFLFWFYMVSIGLIMLVNYYLPSKTVWKGREY
ncbi:glycosyltransferase [Dyadobacter arcticus]|uniref:Cellulose synthase/poly-beta-1,6-N-acetylglucosamine synthase-like glycosyltransferase n=1 Tax=Dyadobacter arcticus TaxID=1078754 RepID=A0ABX0UJ36_9BACT|nr:glycosyltransferase [Dyadobacter arcticus]NIJ52513.1 cellulose synthase/poly-beta-1,6-N-acetylglucosamine synthase-like glycosyltransferase [Dyadobacter arcticus]